MTQVLFGFTLAFVKALVVIAGDIVLKLAADGQKPLLSGLVFAGCAIYAASAVFWFYAMKQVTLAQAGAAYSMLTLLALCVIGALWFGERLYLREYLGIGCALLAMVLLARIA